MSDKTAFERDQRESRGKKNKNKKKKKKNFCSLDIPS